MNFESQNGLKTDGLAGPQVWTDLLADVQSGQGDALPWDYVLVSQSLPETATVYKDGAAVYSTPVNTGVAGAPTENGTWPVFARYTVTTMTGTNPDGSHYATRASRGSATSTAGTPSTASSGAPTASPRATAASRCPSPTPRSSSRSPRSGPWSPSRPRARAIGGTWASAPP